MHIISLGKDCCVSITLRNLGLRKVAYPWDWARYTEIADIIDVIKNRDTFQVESWKNLQNIHEYLPHDNPGDAHGMIENSFENVSLLEKYQRRFQRFFQHIQEPDTYMVRVGTQKDVPFLDELSQLLPHVKIVFIEDGPDIETRARDVLSSVFSQEKDAVYVFLDKMIKVYERHSQYPCGVKEILTTMQQVGIEEPYLGYIREYHPDATFQDKYDFLRYVNEALKTKGFEYSIF